MELGEGSGYIDGVNVYVVTRAPSATIMYAADDDLGNVTTTTSSSKQPQDQVLRF